MKTLIATCLLLLAGMLPAQAQRNLTVDKSGVAEKRVALVIGNSAYKDAPLKNPVNDAKDMAAALRRLGFDVIEKTNVSQKDMNLAIAYFGEKLRSDTVALFFYAGHGIQVRGKNYIIPIDAQISSEATVRAMAVDVDTVMDQLMVSPLNIVILDACRNNPFERKFRSTGGGLAQIDAPKGSLIAYATAPGKTAADGESRNGLYTQELLKHIQTRGLPLEAVFKRVRNGVMAASGEAQTPWESSSLTGDFYFRPAEAGAQEQVAAPAPMTAAEQSSGNALAVELAFWQAAKEHNDPAQLRAYLARYPDGEFAPLARLRLEGGAAPQTTTGNTQSVRPLIDALPASAFQASSTWSNDLSDHGPANARYSITSTFSNWSADHNDLNQWLQVDLQRASAVHAIGTKGRYKCQFLFVSCPPQWVTAYRIAYSLDGANWQYINDGETPRLFAGNSDNHTEMRHEFKEPIRARFLRFHPQSWNEHITMRIEAYGYPAAF